jgi:hypothetical protein
MRRSDMAVKKVILNENAAIDQTTLSHSLQMYSVPCLVFDIFRIVMFLQ